MKAAARWVTHTAEWRDPRQVTSQWREADRVAPALLAHRVTGKFWETLARLKITLLAGREYEHLLMGLTVDRGRPRVTYWPVPHPGGLAVDRKKQTVYVASTRNPNQVYTLAPVSGMIRRIDAPFRAPAHRPLVPVASWFLPGSLYLHDLAMIGGRLHGNAVGWNAVVRFDDTGRVRPVWWPKSVTVRGRPDATCNHLQLNSIAAGRTLRDSFFTASSAAPGAVKPGDPRYPVDRRGVVFSGASRLPVAQGLTRPHSARLWRGRVWVDNSGYGEVGVIEAGRYRPVLNLPGWTRGLLFVGNVGFVATSRVIPRFRAYAPGLDVKTARCGVHAFDPATGRVLGSLEWPAGNQMFALESCPRSMTGGFPYPAGGELGSEDARRLYYGFMTRSR